MLAKAIRFMAVILSGLMGTVVGLWMLKHAAPVKLVSDGWPAQLTFYERYFPFLLYLAVLGGASLFGTTTHWLILRIYGKPQP
jgi:hypothetical protein